MKIIVLPPVKRNSLAASSKTFLTSFTPCEVALSSLKRDLVVFATIRASVVLPTYTVNPGSGGGEVLWYVDKGEGSYTRSSPENHGRDSVCENEFP
jgi:hypothetical protein